MSTGAFAVAWNTGILALLAVLVLALLALLDKSRSTGAFAVAWNTGILALLALLVQKYLLTRTTVQILTGSGMPGIQVL